MISAGQAKTQQDLLVLVIEGILGSAKLTSYLAGKPSLWIEGKGSGVVADWTKH